MTNELRKTLGRNMRFAKMNENIDNQIRQLQAQGSYDVNTQTQINALERQKYLNKQQMQQPMSEIEYEQYDDNGQYIGGQGVQQKMQTEQANGLGQKTLDAVNHAAQGIGLGWSDELNGVIGGVGNVLANGVMRAFGQDVNGESFGDAWKRGYTEYRDFARQELNDGYERNPMISAGSEIVGSVISPVKIHTPHGYVGILGKKISTPAEIARSRLINSIGTGVVNGAGYTNENNPLEYGKNIVMSTIANAGGTLLGNKLFGKGNDMYRFGRGVMNGFTSSSPYVYDLYQRRNNEE